MKTLIEKYNIQIPEELLEGVSLIKTKDKLYMFDRPIEVPDMKGFFYIPSFTRYAINEEGVIIDLFTGLTKSYYTTPTRKEKSITGGYKVAHLKIDFIAKMKGQSRHRCLMRTFKPNRDPKRIIVNHINGIPGDDSLDNLEWVSYSENTKHAYDNNLHPKKVVNCIGWNWKTGEFRYFLTLQAASEYYQRNIDRIYHLFKQKKKRLYDDGIMIKKADDSSWNVDHSKVYNFYGNALVKALNIYTKEITIYDDAAKAARATECNPIYVAQCCRKSISHPYRGYVFRFVSIHVGDNTFPEYSDFDIERYNYGCKLSSPYFKITDTLDNSVTLAYNSSHAAEIIGTSEIHVYRLVRSCSFHENRYKVEKVKSKILAAKW